MDERANEQNDKGEEARVEGRLEARFITRREARTYTETEREGSNAISGYDRHLCEGRTQEFGDFDSVCNAHLVVLRDLFSGLRCRDIFGEAGFVCVPAC